VATSPPPFLFLSLRRKRGPLSSFRTTTDHLEASPFFPLFLPRPAEMKGIGVSTLLSLFDSPRRSGGFSIPFYGLYMPPSPLPSPRQAHRNASPSFSFLPAEASRRKTGAARSSLLSPFCCAERDVPIFPPPFPLSFFLPSPSPGGNLRGVIVFHPRACRMRFSFFPLPFSLSNTRKEVSTRWLFFLKRILGLDPFPPLPSRNRGETFLPFFFPSFFFFPDEQR